MIIEWIVVVVSLIDLNKHKSTADHAVLSAEIRVPQHGQRATRAQPQDPPRQHVGITLLFFYTFDDSHSVTFAAGTAHNYT